MIPEAPYVLSMAALNASFAGLAGLLVALRRGSDQRAMDTLRLRQVIEFAFANLLLAVAFQPSVLVLGSLGLGVQVCSALTLAYIVAALPILHVRVARAGIRWGIWWAAAAIGLSVAGIVLSVVAMIAQSAGLYDLLLVVMLARPMVTFLLVLGSLETA